MWGDGSSTSNDIKYNHTKKKLWSEATSPKITFSKLELTTVLQRITFHHFKDLGVSLKLERET